MPRLAVIGHPVAHSRSPAMQNAALKALGLWPEWEYGCLDFAPAEVEQRTRELAESGDYKGVNVTVPHKTAVLHLATGVTKEVRAIGAANTLIFTPKDVYAHNTDAGGLIGALEGVATPRGRRALVLGAGGAARAAVWALTKSGAGIDATTGVDVWNRTAKRAEALAAQLGGRAVRDPDLGSYGIVVNTTTVGLHGEDPFEHLPLASGFDPEHIVVDMVYGDRPSQLLAAAEAVGATTVDGLEILVQQGARSLEIWTGEKPDLEVMRRAARDW